MTAPQGWMLLKDGAAKVAAQRLADTHQLITTAVAQFHDDALTQIASLHGATEDGLGLELFKGLTDVLMVVFPEELIIEKAAGEAIKAFRDYMIAGIENQEKETAAQTVAQAQEQLRHVLDDLVAGFRASAEQGWGAAHHAIDDSLTAYFEARPDHKNLEFGANADWYEGWICDQIGILDPPTANPAPRIIEVLWAKFNHEVARVSWDMKMQDTPVIERETFDFASWHTLDAAGRLERLSQLDEHAQDELLRGGGFENFLAPDQAQVWKNLAHLWTDAVTRPEAESEAAVIISTGG